MKINLINKPKKNHNAKKKFTKLIKKIIKKKININIKIINSRCMKIMNKKYRKIYSNTDILTFKNKITKNILGDILICETFIKKKKEKLQTIILHGILHLLKYNHKNNTDNKIMTNMQNKIGMSGIEPPTTTTSK